MRTLIIIFALFVTTSANAGNFFPPDYKHFAFQEGDLLVSSRSAGKFSVNKILKVDKFSFSKASSIFIQGRSYVVAVDDFLLIVSAALGADEFSTFEQAKAVTLSGEWTVRVGHVPTRPPGAAAGQTLVGRASVKKSELDGYHLWYRAFEKGNAGVF